MEAPSRSRHAGWGKPAGCWRQNWGRGAVCAPRGRRRALPERKRPPHAVSDHRATPTPATHT